MLAVSGCAGVSGTAPSAGYEIRVEGILDQRWTAWFEGLEITGEDSQTVISGPVVDQAALHGLLNRVADLGLVLVSVCRLDPGPRAAPAEAKVASGPATSSSEKGING